jgi:hypothetical protein
VAAGVDDGLVVVEEAVREVSLAQVKPEPFHGVELGAVATVFQVVCLL